MSNTPKKYIKQNGMLTLNPAYKQWMLSKRDNQVDSPTKTSSIDDLPVAVPAPLPSAPVAPNRTTLTKGRSKRVLMPQPSSKQLSPSESRGLKNQGYTNGLIKSVARSNMQFPLRIWIVDNSGSMMRQDGHRLIESQNNVRYVSCTRWDEIRETVQYHARLAALLEAPTVFRLLNDPGQAIGPQQFSIGERGPEFINEDLNIALNTINAASPTGVTPLSDHIREVKANVEAMKQQLFETGQRVAIVIATDGLPSSRYGASNAHTLNEFKTCLRSLEGLPVWVVVRLCTDEENVVDFYNNLDNELELSLEVIDDFAGEAEEVYECNKWLNYALPLHRIREMGFSHKLFDLLDERPLTKDELKEFFLLMFGPAKLDGMPDPQIDWKGFLKHIEKIVQNHEQKQYNPVKKTVMPWVDVKKLNKAYSPNSMRSIFGR
jgi:hypothetical protein